MNVLSTHPFHFALAVLSVFVLVGVLASFSVYLIVGLPGGNFVLVEEQQQDLSATDRAGIPSPRGYLLELKDPPLLGIGDNEPEVSITGMVTVRQSAGKKAEIQEKRKEHKKNLASAKKKIKNKILSALAEGDLVTGRAAGGDGVDVFFGEYDTVFNGFALDVTEKQAQKLLKLEEAKAIYPNYAVHTLLNESVPQIGADIVHTLNENMIPCNGEGCLTGNGVSIGIVDTGIDFYHSEFYRIGGQVPVERITPVLEKPYLRATFPTYAGSEGSVFSMDNGKVAYANNGSLFVYSFADGTTAEFASSIRLSYNDDMPESFLVQFPVEYLSGKPNWITLSGNVTSVQLNGDMIGYTLRVPLLTFNVEGVQDGSHIDDVLYFVLLNTTVPKHRFGWDLIRSAMPLTQKHFPLYHLEPNSGPTVKITQSYVVTGYKKISYANITVHLQNGNNWMGADLEAFEASSVYPDYLHRTTGPENVVAVSAYNASLGSAGTGCKNMFIIYNMTAGEYTFYQQDNIGDLLAFQKDEALYTVCNTSGTGAIMEFRRYNVRTGELWRASFGAEFFPFQKDAASSIAIDDEYPTFISGDLSDSLFTFNIGKKIAVYDSLNSRMLLFPHNESALYFEADRETVCFYSTTVYQISCHRYDPQIVYEISVDKSVAGGIGFLPTLNDPGYFRVSYPMDDHGHGTHVAAIAGGNGTFLGVAPGASLYAIKVLNSEGHGTYASILSGLEWAADPTEDGDTSDHLDIVSLSLGASCWFGYSPYCGPDDVMSTAIDRLSREGVVAVIAAGNEGPGIKSIGSPGTARSAITVGAVRKNDSLVWFSSRGPVTGVYREYMTVKPDIVAPGVSICAAKSAFDKITSMSKSDLRCRDAEHLSLSGTSMATPHVSGAVALLLQKNPDWTPAEIKAALMSTATPMEGSPTFVGAGRLNIKKAVELNGIPSIAVLETGGWASGTVYVKGTAAGRGFAGYTLSYGAGDPPVEWIDVAAGTVPVVNGVFGQIDASILPPGITTLRLLVSNDQGEVSKAINYLIKSTAAGVVDCISSPCIADRSRIGSRDTIEGKAEQNQPNTALPFCADGIYGSYLSDESVEELRIDVKGGAFFPGSKVQATVTVFCYDQDDTVNLVYASEKSPPKAVPLGKCVVNKTKTFKASVTLDKAIGTHVIGATVQYPGELIKKYFGITNVACGDGVYDDNDHVAITFPPCKDIDGEDPFNSSSVVTEEGIIKDTCKKKAPAVVLEQVCAAGSGGKPAHKQVELPCPTGCVSGACDSRLYDSGFENGLTAVITNVGDLVTPVGRWGLLLGAAVSGKNGRKALNLPNGSGAVQIIPALPETSYTLAAVASNPSYMSSTATFQFLDNSGAVLFTTGAQGGKETSLSAVSPAGTTFLRVILQASASRKTSRTVSWDNVRVV